MKKLLEPGYRKMIQPKNGFLMILVKHVPGTQKGNLFLVLGIPFQIFLRNVGFLSKLIIIPCI